MRPPPPPARLQEVRELFEAALELPGPARAALLVERTTTDPELRARVEALLAAHAAGDGFLEPPPLPPLPALVAARAPERERTGLRVGGYVLVRRIGAGGMGTVYEGARADDAFERRVAVKFLRHTLADEGARRRFQAERRILANLAHPNIAALLDGGTTDGGEPYFVMELVAGEPITAWCDARRLPVERRLGLFLQVCAAVHAAHQQLVVHRDLKPGNILVADDGTVKLLDFGIAKLLADDAGGGAADAGATLAGALAFTPDYAAPEQVRGEPVRTTADVHALGVLLHELLAGRRPFDLGGRTRAEMERVLATEVPPPPSVRIDAARAALLGEPSAARARSRVAGDLDAIVAMALRKEPERRYASAAELARDVRLHLARQPVTARADGVAYRLGRFVRRRWRETAAVVLVVASLAGALAVSTAQRRRADAERAEAERQRQRAEAVTTFLTTMLGSADPRTRGRDVTVREVLDSAAVQADTLRATPAIESAVRTAIGSTYIELGMYDAAVAQLERDVAARRRAEPAGSFGLGTAISRLALAHEYAGRYAVADSLLRQSAAVFAVHPPPDPVELASMFEDRARILVALGRPAEARRLLAEAIAVQRRDGAPVDSAIAYTYGNAANAASEANDQVAADTLLRLGEGAARRAFGEAHPLVATMMSLHAGVYERMGRLREADSAYRAAIALRRRVLGPEHPNTLWAVANHADHLATAGRWDEAAAAARLALAGRGATLDDAHPAVGAALGTLARALARRDSAAAAERLAREVLRLRRANFPADHWTIPAAQGTLGEVLALGGRHAEAEALLLASERALVAARGPASDSVRRARQRLALLYERWGRPEAAARWRAAASPSTS